MASIPPTPDLQQPPPPYAEAVGAAAPQTPLDLSPTTQRLAEDLLEEDDALASNSPAPPPFSVTPGTLLIAPQALLIHSPIAGARPLYQLLNPLNGHATHNLLIDIPATRRLKPDGTLLRAPRDRDQLYRLQRPHVLFVKPNVREVAVSGQHGEHFGDVLLRKESAVGITGVKCSYAALSPDEAGRARTLYQARLKKGVWEWHDGGGTLVAVETPAVDRQVQEESLEIVVALDKRHLDLVVALWVARIYQDSQEEGEREDREDARHRKAEQKELDKQEGKPHGVLHDVKEALGIGHGAKRSGLGMMSWTGTKDDGRINWGM